MTDVRSTDAELRALAADMPGSVELGLSELVARVFATDSTQLRSEDGAEFEVERVTTYRALASVLAPNLAVEPRLLVTGGCSAPDPSSAAPTSARSPRWSRRRAPPPSPR